MASKALMMIGTFARTFGLDNFEEIGKRIIFQKKVYLLKICGLDLGYHYAWDLYGPYSRSLARNIGAYTERKEEVDDAARGLELTTFAEGKIEETNALIAIPEEQPIEESVWVEVLASIHYLTDMYYRSEADFRAQVTETKASALDRVAESLIKKKPHLTAQRALIDIAWNRLLPYLPKDDHPEVKV